MVVAATGGASFLGHQPDPQPVAAVEPCCLQLVPVGPVNVAAGPSGEWRVAERDEDLALPPGVAPEKGLQVKTILASRSVSAAFPEIHDIGGVRADSLRWHPNGLALDVMIPNPSSADGIALGNQIVAFAMKNAVRFDLNHVIWRGTMYFPSGSTRSASGHYDHVHIATNGDGYPKGGELYLR